MSHLQTRLNLVVAVFLTVVCAWPLGPVAGAESSASSASPAAQAAPADLQALQLVGPGRGWVLLDQQLFWTDDSGQQWRVITPAVGGETILAATFADADHGWIITLTSPDPAVPAYRLYRTADAGRTWDRLAPHLFDPGDPSALAQAVYLEFIDPNTGWLVVQQATSSAFNQGTLFGTTDGGATWQRLALPAAGPVQFTTPAEGTLEAGPPEAGRYLTRDGGRTWERQTAEAAPAASDPGGVSLVSAVGEHAWGRSSQGQCDDTACELVVTLVETRDGGQTWTALPLPGGQPSLAHTFTPPVQSAAADTYLGQSGLRILYAGHGFDSCYRPSVEQMQTWYNASPYKVWNLYLGGSSRFTGCGTLSFEYVQSLVQQGWLFIPTWVGPQPPCSNVGRNRKMSWDLGTAYNEGISEALMALDSAEALGLTLPGQSGTIIYYDIEIYPNNDACRAAARSFISGWTAALQARGTRAGVYGSPCSSYLSDLVSANPVPDAVWMAAWRPLGSSFDPNASVWGLNCLSDTLWAQNQRLRQYAGDHTENWGGVSLPIDSNVIAGPVATARGNCSPNATQVALFTYANFGGACAVRGIGDYSDPGAMGFANDTLSSVRVGAGVRLRVCEHDHYTGVCQFFTGLDSNLWGDPIGDNRVSSMQVSAFSPVFTTRAWFPLHRVSPPVTTPLPNSSFESGPSTWSTFSQQGLNVIVPNNVLASAAVTPRTGSWAVWMGGVHTETVRLEQFVTIPHEAPVLSYWHWIKSSETGCYYDVATVWVNTTVVESYGLCGNTNGWVRQSIDLSAHRGSLILLRFQVTTDATLTSSLFIDDVVLRSGP